MEVKKKTFQATATKQDLGTCEGLFSKFLTSTPIRFIWESLLCGPCFTVWANLVPRGRDLFCQHHETRGFWERDLE